MYHLPTKAMAYAFWHERLCVKSYPKYGFVMDEKMQLQRLRHLIIIISSLEKKGSLWFEAMLGKVC